MSIHNTAMLVDLKISQWTGRKLDRKVSEEVASNKHSASDAGRYNKQLISKTDLQAIDKAVSSARATHYRLTLPWDDRGPRILPSAMYLDYTQTMRQHRGAMEAAVDAFIARYATLVAQQQTRLGDMFNADDYPSPSALRSKFDFTTEVSPMPVSQDFRVDLGEMETKRVQQQLEDRLLTAQQGAMQDLWDRITNILNRYKARLTSDKPIIRDSLVGEALDLVDLLPKLNLTNDPKLEAVRRDIETSLCKHSAESLRLSASAREETLKSTDAIMDLMGSLYGAPDEQVTKSG